MNSELVVHVSLSGQAFCFSSQSYIIHVYIYLFIIYIYIFKQRASLLSNRRHPPPKKTNKTKPNTAKLLRSLIINKSHCTKNAIVYKKGSLFYVDSKLFKL